jgi:N-acetylmuramoyl-L-alanine amidase
MRVVENRLWADVGKPVPFVRSPHVGGRIVPHFIVMHYTGGQSAESAVAWMTSPQSGVSAHLVIGRDGSVIQLVPFNRQAQHAGPSQWKGIQGLGAHSIGIELDNPGPMKSVGGKWKATFGKAYDGAHVLEAPHKHGGRYTAWYAYTPVQIEVAVEVARALVREFPIEEILGHDDISPGRKWDPGPAFPLDDFCARVFA